MKKNIAVALGLALSLCVGGCGAPQQSNSAAVPAPINADEDTKVSYLGPEGTYTEEAAEFFFDGTGILFPKETVNDAIKDVDTGASQYAVIPQENTLGGVVTDYVDALLAEDDIYVVGEIILPINQTLLGVPGATIDDIEKVCSHVQGLRQTETWRQENLPDAETEEMASTAAAASYVAEQKDKSIAAIGAPGAADLYGLSVLAEKIQLTDANKTRFYVLSNAPLPEGGSPRAVFSAECEANRLEDIIVSMHNAGLDLVTVHDRPEGSALGKYRYIIETESKNGITTKQIDEVTKAEEVRFLGSFQMIEKTEPVS